MKIVVKEMFDDCTFCRFRVCHDKVLDEHVCYCGASKDDSNKYDIIKDKVKRNKDCPLVLKSDYDKRVRAEVLAEIVKYIETASGDINEFTRGIVVLPKQGVEVLSKSFILNKIKELKDGIK